MGGSAAPVSARTRRPPASGPTRLVALPTALGAAAGGLVCLRWRQALHRERACRAGSDDPIGYLVPVFLELAVGVPVPLELGVDRAAVRARLLP